MQELGIHMTEPTVVYCDSQSTIFVSNDATSVKRSVWLLRRAAVLREAVDAREFVFNKIGDPDNCADMNTKAIPLAKLKHLMSHTHEPRA